MACATCSTHGYDSRRRGRATQGEKPARLVDRLEHPLVVERARHRSELVAELTRRLPHRVRLHRLRVLPDLDDGEMVGPVGLLHDLEAHVARVLAAVVTELLDGGEAVLLAWRNDVDVRHHVDGVAGGTGPEGADRDADVHALVDRGVADRLDLLAELRGVRRLPVRLERLLVLPDLQDHELVRLADAAHHLGPSISVLLAGRLPGP